MCVVSMIMDHYWDRWRDRYVPAPQPWEMPRVPPPLPAPSVPTKEEIEEFRKLLERAKEYDKKNNEPECENEKKRQLLLDLAKQLGIEINFI